MLLLAAQNKLLPTAPSPVRTILSAAFFVSSFLHFSQTTSAYAPLLPTSLSIHRKHISDRWSSPPCVWTSVVTRTGTVRHQQKQKEEQEQQEELGVMMDDDATLLQKVPKKQLVELCQQFQLPSQGRKQDLLMRLREHASQQAELERQRRLERVRRVEQGTSDNNSKERYEIVSDELPDDYLVEDEDEAVFYFPSPDQITRESPTNSSATSSMPHEGTAKKTKKPAFIPNSVITTPPPPTEPNENGERTVTVYSTTDQNDLTGIAAAQPGQTALGGDALTNAAAVAAVSSSSSSSSNQPWDMQQSQKSSTATSQELEQAQERVLELVQTLLAMTGVRGFRSFDDDDDNDDDDDDTRNHNRQQQKKKRASAYAASPKNGFVVGFNPAKVPTDLLTASSKALRAGRGQVLQEVMQQFELQAIGLDGMAGDDTEKGGGHYREVSKVRAFLEGYRRAEVRRIARETTALLLDKLVLEGIEGLDITLASMTRSSDDTSDHAGELNDSLLDYLNDAIREQEKKVDLLVADRIEKENKNSVQHHEQEEEEDLLEPLWNVTTEDGQRVASIDPSDPNVKKALHDEYSKSERVGAADGDSLPTSAPEKLLLLLTLLRERIKVEAAFVPDEKGRNLRLLAYCLQLSSDEQREQLILNEIGSSLDRMDSFIELVTSSIEYGESTSHQLQPMKKQTLNIKQLKTILKLAEDLRERQSFRASGVVR